MPDKTTLHDESSVGCMAITKPSDFDITIALVSEQANKGMLRHIYQHIQHMQDAKVMNRVRESIDFNPENVTPEDMATRLGRQLMYFEKDLLPTIKDGASLYKACVDYIDVQLEQLFFYTNDRASARIALDYLRSFVDASRVALDAQGLLDAHDHALLDRIPAYAAFGMRSYDDARACMLEAGQHNGSMISAALERAGVEGAVLASVVETPKGMSDKVRDVYRGLVEHTPFNPGPQHDVPTTFMGLVAGAYRAVDAHVQQQQVTPPAMKPRRPVPVVKQRKALLGRVSHGMLASMGRVDDAVMHALVGDARAEQEVYRALQVDGDTDALIDHVHALAVLESKKALLASEHPVRMKQPPASQWMAEMYNMGSKERAREHWEDIIPGIAEPLHEAKNLKRMVLALDQVVDDTAENVVYLGCEPKVLDALRAYVACVRREMGKARIGTPMYDEKAIIAMSHIEAKCTLAIESYYALKPMVMDATGGAYDDCYLDGVAKMVAESGKQANQFDSDEKRGAEKKAEAMFEEALVQAAIDNPYFNNPYMPALFARCHRVAALRDDRDPNSKHDPIQVDAAAHVMLSALLDRMPRSKNEQGRMTKYITLEPVALGTALRTLAREEERLRPMKGVIEGQGH